AGAVVAAVAHEHVEKRVRIVVIADPTAAAEIKVELALCAQIGLPFQLPELGFDAEFAEPHCLKFNCDLLLQLRRGVEEIMKRRKSLSARKPGIGQKPARQLRIVAQALRRFVTTSSWRCVSRGNLPAAFGDFRTNS